MTQTKPFILITNDDGIDSSGIKHLWEATCDFAELAIVAPHREKSGSALSVTSTKPLTIHARTWEDATPTWSINDGTPADCVKMALRVLLPKPPELILSGINRGSNAGKTVLYSGTVGGVMEGVLRSIPGIAFSFFDIQEHAIGTARSYIRSIINYFLQNPLPTGSFINVNFPPHYEGKIQGVRMARQGKSYWIEHPERRLHPEGNPYYWLGGSWSSCEEDPDSDVAMLMQGYVTIVPIHIGDLTDQTLIDKHKNGITQLNVEQKEASSLK